MTGPPYGHAVVRWRDLSCDRLYLFYWYIGKRVGCPVSTIIKSGESLSAAAFLIETTSISSSPTSSMLTMVDANSPPAASRPTPSEEDYGSWTWKQKFEDPIACDPSRNIMPKHPESASYIKKKLRYINSFLQFPERRLNIGY